MAKLPYTILDYTAAASAAVVATLAMGTVLVHPNTNRVPAACAGCGAPTGVHRCDSRSAVMGVMREPHITLCANKKGKRYTRCQRVFAVCHACWEDATLVAHADHAKVK